MGEDRGGRSCIAAYALGWARGDRRLARAIEDGIIARLRGEGVAEVAKQHGVPPRRLQRLVRRAVALNADGSPRHPLYVPYTAVPVTIAPSPRKEAQG